jgi:hypothetical protein
MLKAETGPGEIGDYIEHPLNFNKSAWMARLIRGLTGLVGNLRLALVDIGLALVEGWKARVAAVKQDAAEQ